MPAGPWPNPAASPVRAGLSDGERLPPATYGISGAGAKAAHSAPLALGRYADDLWPSGTVANGHRLGLFLQSDFRSARTLI